MDASWMENTDKRSCLCCGQKVGDESKARTWPHASQWALLDALGYTRDSLLTKHRAQIDFQMPGLAEWLQT